MPYSKKEKDKFNRKMDKSIQGLRLKIVHVPFEKEKDVIISKRLHQHG